MKKHTANVMTHVEDGEGLHLVAAALRVLVYPRDDGGFAAQGLEIDYFATGESVDEVRENFTNGLMATVRAYVRRGRDLAALFRKGRTPADAWQAWLDGDDKDSVTCVTAFEVDDTKLR